MMLLRDGEHAIHQVYYIVKQELRKLLLGVVVLP
jgi:hypothetical protein